MNSLSASLVELLADSGLGLTEGDNLWLASLPPDTAPDLAVAVLGTGGEAPEQTMGAPLIQTRQHSAQVTIRGPADDKDGGRELAADVYGAIARANGGTISPWLSIKPTQAAAVEAATDPQGRCIFLVDVEGLIRETLPETPPLSVAGTSDRELEGNLLLGGELRVYVGDSSATPGDATLNTIAGRSALDPGNLSITITNNKAHAGDLLFVSIESVEDETDAMPIIGRAIEGALTIETSLMTLNGKVVVAWWLVGARS